MTAQDALARPQAAKLTIEDFLLLDRSGAFAAYAKTELIDGKIIVVNAQFASHYTAKTRFLRRLADACDAHQAELHTWVEGAIRIEPASVPEPDLFVTTTEPEVELISADALVLVVEVASTTLRLDMGRKLRLYAAASIPEYWVLDLEKRVIHQMWAPQGSRYAERREIGLGERIEAATIPGLGVETEGIA